MKLMNPSLEKLLAAPTYRRIVELANKATLRKRLRGGGDNVSVVWHAALRGAAGPSTSEKMTRQERTRLAGSITRSAAELRESLGAVFSGGVPYQFQSNLDALAADAASSYAETFDPELRSKLEQDDTLHYARFAIYHLLMRGLADTLETLEEGADWWESEEQYLAKPNHPNAARLYFIRRATEIFYVEFGQPMRELTLELTSVYFDCADLSEADLSRLAPVRNIKHPLLHTAE